MPRQARRKGVGSRLGFPIHQRPSFATREPCINTRPARRLHRPEPAQRPGHPSSRGSAASASRATNRPGRTASLACRENPEKSREILGQGAGLQGTIAGQDQIGEPARGILLVRPFALAGGRGGNATVSRHCGFLKTAGRSPSQSLPVGQRQGGGEGAWPPRAAPHQLGVNQRRAHAG